MLKKIDEYLNEGKWIKHQDSTTSLQMLDSLCTEDRHAWCTIWKELEHIGITVAELECNKDTIFGLLEKAVESGAFQEWTLPPNLMSNWKVILWFYYFMKTYLKA
jgi:hypothetical protein